MLYDKDIREPLFEFLEERCGKVRILEEKQIGRSRADAVMVTRDALAGIEIKSDADTYARLGRQVRDYSRFFDYNFVAVGSTHGGHIEEHVPDWWGIITVEQQGHQVDFYVLRQAKRNPAVDWKGKLGLLWRPELAHIQEVNRMPGYRDKGKRFVIDKILERVPKEILGQQISQELFERDYTKIEGVIREYRKGRRQGLGAKRRGRGTLPEL